LHLTLRFWISISASLGLYQEFCKNNFVYRLPQLQAAEPHQLLQFQQQPQALPQPQANALVFQRNLKILNL
jgi:hypothetical protein